MPSYPNISAGEGFVRAQELLEMLNADVHEAYRILEADRESQYLRRCVVRAIFSFIEAAIECIKNELRSYIRTRQFTEPLSERDMETLGHTRHVSDEGKHLPLEQNIKRTFKLAAKMWGLDHFKLQTHGDEYRAFISAKNARNKLTHPKTFYDIQVTDEDMSDHTVAGQWVLAELQRLMQAQIDSLMSELPSETR